MGALVNGKLLLGTKALPRLVEYLATEFPGNLCRPVRASRVDNDNLLCECHTLKTGRQVLCLIFDYDGY